jgi:hypothetical protein
MEGCLVNIVLWIAATCAIFMSGLLAAPAILAAFVAGLIAVIQAGTRTTRIRSLVHEYTQRYGEPPPGFSDTGTRVGAAAGIVGGHYVLGGLLGMAVDAVRHGRRTRDMGAEQKAMNDQIRGLQAWSPFTGIYLFYTWLAMTAGAAWLYQSAGGF